DPAAVLRSWFELPASGSVRARVVVTNERNSFTTLDERGVEVAGGVPTDEDLSLATVVPRARLRPGAAPHEPVVGLVAGLGLRRGAFATTFAHDNRKSTRLNSSHVKISAAVVCLKTKRQHPYHRR